MKHKGRLAEEEGCIDLIERAVHLLRTAPLSTLILYYIGAIPFVMGALFFLADMSTSPFADERCAGASLGLALLFVWMRGWQSRFCNRLRERHEQRSSKAMSFGGLMRLFLFQLVYASWELVLLPMAALVVIPFGWVYAYFNNLCMVDAGSCPMKQAAEKARAQSMPWPKQNHLVITILFAFAFFVFVNIVIVLVQIPALLKSIAGIDTQFAHSYYWIGNTTFLGITVALTYLVVDPLVKAVYVLRFSASESISSGEDLLSELKRIPPKRRAAGIARAGIVAALVLTACSVHAAPEQSPPADHFPIKVPALNKSVDHVMKSSEFTWRMPREYAPEKNEHSGFFGKFLDSVYRWVKKGFLSIGHGLERFFKWLGDRFTAPKSRHHASTGMDPSFFKGLAVAAIVVLGTLLLIFLVKVLRTRRLIPSVVEKAEPLSVAIDLEDENLVATLLEEDEWIAMARELAGAGELRKAVRAWFLAGLAFLARKELLAVRHSKSNLEYRRELMRRARRCPEVIPVFGDNIRLFERAWYGLHAVSMADIGLLEQNMERMRHGCEA